MKKKYLSRVKFLNLIWNNVSNEAKHLDIKRFKRYFVFKLFLSLKYKYNQDTFERIEFSNFFFTLFVYCGVKNYKINEKSDWLRLKLDLYQPQ